MIKSIAKIGASAAFMFFKTLVLGQIITMAFFVISIVLLLVNSGSTDGVSAAGHAGGAGGLGGILNFFVVDFWPSLSATLNIVLFLPLYIFIAKKLATETALKKLWENNLHDVVLQKIGSYIDSSDKVAKASDYLSSKQALLDESRGDNDTPAWQKRVLSYILNRADLNDVDFSKNQDSVKALVTTRVSDYMAEFTQTSSHYFYSAIAIQCVLLAAAVILNK